MKTLFIHITHMQALDFIFFFSEEISFPLRPKIKYAKAMNSENLPEHIS